MAEKRGLTRVPYSECASARTLAARVSQDAIRASSCANAAGAENT